MRKLAEWRHGMALMAQLPHARVKLSMLGYAVPAWHASPAKEALLRGLVRETVELFGADRCMFASNFHVNAAVSDSDGAAESGCEFGDLYARFESWVSDYTDEQRGLLFAGSARAFYKL